jgi:hypothetical protein
MANPENKKFAEGVTMSDAARQEVQKRIDARTANDHLLEAAKEAEDLVRLMVGRWQERGFTFEQGTFALALATINFRETAPEKNGGKEAFDLVAHEAHVYYHANK